MTGRRGRHPARAARAERACDRATRQAPALAPREGQDGDSAHSRMASAWASSDDWNAVFERVAGFVDSILRGAKPQALPVELATKFRVIVNAKTARALKLNVPPSLLAKADAILE